MGWSEFKACGRAAAAARGGGGCSSAACRRAGLGAGGTAAARGRAQPPAHLLQAHHGGRGLALQRAALLAEVLGDVDLARELCDVALAVRDAAAAARQGGPRAGWQAQRQAALGARRGGGVCAQRAGAGRRPRRRRRRRRRQRRRGARRGKPTAMAPWPAAAAALGETKPAPVISRLLLLAVPRAPRTRAHRPVATGAVLSLIGHGGARGLGCCSSVRTAAAPAAHTGGGGWRMAWAVAAAVARRHCCGGGACSKHHPCAIASPAWPRPPRPRRAGHPGASGSGIAPPRHRQRPGSTARCSRCSQSVPARRAPDTLAPPGRCSGPRAAPASSPSPAGRSRESVREGGARFAGKPTRPVLARGGRAVAVRVRRTGGLAWPNAPERALLGLGRRCWPTRAWGGSSSRQFKLTAPPHPQLPPA
jgi:hypothetical protein